MSAPLVSVVVPAYEAEAFVEAAIDSALAQDHPSVEVIVVDDGSRDRTAEIAAGRPVRLLRRPHLGPSAARNAGVAVARGAFIAVLDADDLWPPDRLSRQLAHLEQNPGLGLTLGLTEAFLSPGEAPPPHWNPDWEREPIPAVAGTMLVRREVMERVGGYDESLQVCEDVDWLARAKDLGIRAGAVDHVVLRYRIHAANTSRDTAGNTATLLRVLRRSVGRQRSSADV